VVGKSRRDPDRGLLSKEIDYKNKGVNGRG